jgi:hypothetical protein
LEGVKNNTDVKKIVSISQKKKRGLSLIQKPNKNHSTRYPNISQKPCPKHPKIMSKIMSQPSGRLDERSAKLPKTCYARPPAQGATPEAACSWHGFRRAPFVQGNI